MWFFGLASFPSNEGNLIQLAYFAGFCQREISERTAVPLGNMKTQTASAFERSRAELTIQDASREKVHRGARRSGRTWRPSSLEGWSLRSLMCNGSNRKARQVPQLSGMRARPPVTH